MLLHSLRHPKKRAIIFDLFGTLVGNFSRRENDKVVAQMAEILNVPYPQFWQRMGETYADRCLGRYACIEELMRAICSDLGLEPRSGARAYSDAANIHYKFMANALIPKPEVLDALNTLKDAGLKLGLISDCGPSVPRLFPLSPLAECIDTPVFSCDVHLKKPSLSIYEVACHRLRVQPEACLYVGDGSSEELTGAATAGMLPILKRTDLTGVYDAHRPDVENWQGPVIDEIRELCDMMQQT